MLVDSRDLPLCVVLCILLSDLRLSLFLWAIHVVFKTNKNRWYIFLYGDYNPNREKDSV